MKVEKGVPRPLFSKKHPSKYPFADMADGDSFKVEGKSAAVAAYNAGRGRGFVIRYALDDACEWRVWKVGKK